MEIVNEAKCFVGQKSQHAWKYRTYCVCVQWALTSSISVMTLICAHKPFTSLFSQTNPLWGSKLIANECMSCHKVWPLVTKTTCCSADVYTVASQQRNQACNQPCWVSVPPSFAHTHTLIEGNYRAWAKTSARGRMVLHDEWSDPDDIWSHTEVGYSTRTCYSGWFWFSGTQRK